MEVSGRKEDPQHLDGQSVILCQPCQGDGDTISAEGFCETCNEFICTSCIKAHRKLAVTKNHVIKSRHEMPRTQSQNDTCTEPCAIHKPEIVKFYCEGHNTVGCGDCMILEHTSCKVKLVTDVSSNYRNSEELTAIKRRIDQMQREINARKAEMQLNVQTAAEINKKVIQEIKEFRKEVNMYLDVAEYHLLKEFKERKRRDTLLQSKLHDECGSIEKEIKEFQNKLESSAGKMNQLFVTAKLAQNELQTFLESVNSLEAKCYVHSYTFKPYEGICTLLKNRPSLGTIQPMQNKARKQRKKSIVDRKAIFSKTVDIKTVGDEYVLNALTGLTQIRSDEILLADCGAATLKILNVKDNKITSVYKTPSQPWDVTTIDAETAAASLPNTGNILFLNVRDGLSEIRTLKVRKGCKGIDHRNGVIAVSFTEPPAVQILNMEGNVQYEVNDKAMLTYPGYVVLGNANKSIFVSDATENAVYMLQKDVDKIAPLKFEGFKLPSVLAATDHDTVVVCSGKPDMLSVIVPSTREVLSFSVQKLGIPFSILVSEEQGRLYSCEKESPCIKIFELI